MPRDLYIHDNCFYRRTLCFTISSIFSEIPQMATGIDFTDYLCSDMISRVMVPLDDPADVLRFSAASRACLRLVINDGICKKLWLAKHVIREDREIREYIVPFQNAADAEMLLTEHKIYSSLSQPLMGGQVIRLRDCIKSAIGASSTLRNEIGSINHTMCPVDEHAFGTSYWSSEGQNDPDLPENIIYRLCTDVCIVTEVNIRPFGVLSEPGNPVYSPKSVRFRLGHPNSMADLNMISFPRDNPFVDDYVWTYTSPEFPVAQEASLQQFKLPEPVICIGGVVQIELLGRAQRNESDSLFYIRLGYVRVLGMPLGPAYTVNRYVNEEELQLRYDPAPLKYVLQRLCA